MDETPVAEIFWTNENPEWQLNMLCEPLVREGVRLQLCVKEWPADSPPLC